MIEVPQLEPTECSRGGKGPGSRLEPPILSAHPELGALWPSDHEVRESVVVDVSDFEVRSRVAGSVGKRAPTAEPSFSEYTLERGAVLGEERELDIGVVRSGPLVQGTEPRKGATVGVRHIHPRQAGLRRFRPVPSHRHERHLGEVALLGIRLPFLREALEPSKRLFRLCRPAELTKHDDPTVRGGPVLRIEFEDTGIASSRILELLETLFRVALLVPSLQVIRSHFRRTREVRQCTFRVFRTARVDAFDVLEFRRRRFRAEKATCRLQMDTRLGRAVGEHENPRQIQLIDEPVRLLRNHVFEVHRRGLIAFVAVSVRLELGPVPERVELRGRRGHRLSAFRARPHAVRSTRRVSTVLAAVATASDCERSQDERDDSEAIRGRPTGTLHDSGTSRGKQRTGTNERHLPITDLRTLARMARERRGTQKTLSFWPG